MPPKNTQNSRKTKRKKAKKTALKSAETTFDLPDDSGFKATSEKKFEGGRSELKTPLDYSLYDNVTELVEYMLYSANSIYMRRFSRIPEPLKYALIFLTLSVIVMFAGMILLPILIAVTSLTSRMPQATVVESNTVNLETTTTSSTTTSITSSSTTTTSTSSTSTSTTTPLVICTQPYMRFGLGCCLDMNKNSICDTDEVRETTTTTLSDYVRCFNDLDCGPPRLEYKCGENDVYRVTVTYSCRNAGTRVSDCETNVVEDMVEHCGAHQQCYVSRDGSGVCKDRYAESNFL